MDERESLRNRLLDHDRSRGGGQGTAPGRQRTLIHSRILSSFVAEIDGYIQARHEAGLLVDQAVLTGKAIVRIWLRNLLAVPSSP